MKYNDDDLNNIKSDETMEDIADYYRNLNSENGGELTPADSEFSIYDTDSSPSEAETEPNIDNVRHIHLPDKFPDRKNIIFFSATAAAALLILTVFFIIGTAVEKAEEDVNFELAHILDASQDYSNAEKSIEDVNKTIEELKEEIEEKQAELDTITDFESNTGTLKSKLKVLKDELENLKDDVSYREQTLSSLDSSISKKLIIPFDLTPGIYIAGKSINTGKFNVTGDGIMTVSGADGNLRVNTVLSDDEFTLQIKDGDTLKLETSAEFTPVQ